MFAQRGNLLRPRFLRMLRDILRFNRITTAIAETRRRRLSSPQPIGDFLGRHALQRRFRDWYFLPMIGCIWSCPTDQMLRFPVATMIRFCHNHGLIRVSDRPQWHTVRGGARHYVQQDAARASPMRGWTRRCAACAACRRAAASAGVWVDTDRGSEHFDDVVLACHSDQSLALLARRQCRPSARVLGAIRYQPQPRRAAHRHASVLPRRAQAWAAWNYERAAGARRGSRRPSACTT